MFSLDHVSQIREKIEKYLTSGKQIFATSSFQSHSIPLVHILSQFNHDITIYYSSTGYLFPETIRFSERLSKEWGFKLIGLKSAVPKSRQLDSNGRLLFASDPDNCCLLNKVQPLEPVLMKHDVWINGIRADQSDNRRNLREEEQTPHNCLRYHPMLRWDSRIIHAYIKEFNLPPHPLESQGYLSIGCEPCTTKFFDDGNARNARWFGMNKTECGLNTQLIAKSR